MKLYRHVLRPAAVMFVMGLGGTALAQAAGQGAGPEVASAPAPPGAASAPASKSKVTSFLEGVTGKPLTDEQKQALAAALKTYRAGLAKALGLTTVELAAKQKEYHQAHPRASVRYEALLGKPLTTEQKQAVTAAAKSYREAIARTLGITPEELIAREKVYLAAQRDKAGVVSVVEGVAGKALTDDQRQAVAAAVKTYRGNLAKALGITADQLTTKQQAYRQQHPGAPLRYEGIVGQPLSSEQKQAMTAVVTVYRNSLAQILGMTSEEFLSKQKAYLKAHPQAPANQG